MPRPRLPAPSGPLPDFDHPPLAEVVLGFQFDPLVALTAARLGEVWGLFRDRFPKTEDRVPLGSVFERLGGPPEPQGIQLGMELLRPQLPRLWFISEGDDELLQFQHDRFHHNWRQREDRPVYPRYPTIRSRFESEAKLLTEFISDSGIGIVEINQCEVSYINHIIADENWSDHGHAGRVVRFFAEDADVSLGALEHVRFDTSFLIHDEGLAPRGRLHVSLVSGFMKKDSKRMFSLTLTARGAPMGPGVGGALEFLDLGRRWIVTGFANLTTERMQKAWGRIG